MTRDPLEDVYRRLAAERFHITPDQDPDPPPSAAAIDQYIHHEALRLIHCEDEEEIA